MLFRSEMLPRFPPHGKSAEGLSFVGLKHIDIDLNGPAPGQQDKTMPDPGAEIGDREGHYMHDRSSGHGHQDNTMTGQISTRLVGQQQHDSWTSGRHREVICSQCCVEKGFDGDVVCLGCLPYV